MPKTINRLSALKAARLIAPGLHPDGNGLYLAITAGQGKSWVFRYSFRGRSREMGLGSFRKVSLEEARRKAIEFGKLRDEGRDPIEERLQIGRERLLERAKSLTLSEAWTRFIQANQASWKNAKHAAQWTSTFSTYVQPTLGGLAVDKIDTGLIVGVIQPLWTTKPETASRIRGRIECVLDWCKVHGCRDGENPARWRGHLDKVLPAKSKVRAVRHHAALPYDQLPEFMVALRAQNGVAARALEFTILTAARTNETIGGRPSEISERECTWTIPGGRMKAGREHRVPLSDRALEILRDADTEPYLFPGLGSGRPLSNMAMAQVLARMGMGHVTVHGFRSTFKDWARDRTNFPNELSEAALAHVIGDKTEAAYARGTMFERRRRLMDAWALYALTSRTSVAADAVPIRA